MLISHPGSKRIALCFPQTYSIQIFMTFFNPNLRTLNQGMLMNVYVRAVEYKKLLTRLV